MSRWPFVVVAMLILLPMVLMAGVGAWTLIDSGHWRWLAWTLPTCWTLAWIIARTTSRTEIPLPKIGSELHWTPQDRAAMAIIEEETKRVHDFTGEQLTDPQFYTTRTIELATEFARHYHPSASDPLGSASVVELLAAVQMAAADIEDFVLKNVPGGHLITVSQWKLLANAPAWWRTASNLSWLVSVVVNPTAIGRYAISKAFADPLSRQIQTNLLGAFYALYVRQLGYYLIELNSGRLRGGSFQYRSAMHRIQPADAVDDEGEAIAPEPKRPVPVTIAVIGQVKAGKSSLINCLLGEQRAAVDVLPATRSVQRYELAIEDQPGGLVVLDTPGYDGTGASETQAAETREAVRNADLVLLVVDSRSPAKQADVSILDGLRHFFKEERRLKPAPIIAVMSKIDGLTPVMEWSPPYSWESPTRPKEQSIRSAMDFVRQTFGDRVESVVPVCTDREHGRVFGVEEYLLPMLTLHLDEARAVSLVRSLHRDYDQQRTWQVLSQLVSAGNKIKEFAPEFTKSQLGQAAKSLLSNLVKRSP